MIDAWVQKIQKLSRLKPTIKKVAVGAEGPGSFVGVDVGVDEVAIGVGVEDVEVATVHLVLNDRSGHDFAAGLVVAAGIRTEDPDVAVFVGHG